VTRRADVVRSSFTADPTTPRARGAGCTILCTNWVSMSFGSDPGNPTNIGPIRIESSENYQRIFVAATLNDLRHNGGGDIYISTDTSAVGAITSIRTGGGAACLTGVCDLPAGTHDIFVRIYTNTTDGGGGGDVGDVYLQVIVGQTVASPGCPGGGGGSS
jgi:hypothetical protein